MSEVTMTMDSAAKGIKPIGDRVLLRLKEVEKKIAVRPSGIILPGQDQMAAGQAIGGSMGVTFRAIVESIGEKVKTRSKRSREGYEIWYDKAGINLGYICRVDKNPLERVGFFIGDKLKILIKGKKIASPHS